MAILVCQGYHNEVPKIEWLEQQKFIVSYFWKLEVQDQGLVVPQLVQNNYNLHMVSPWVRVCLCDSFFPFDNKDPNGLILN